MIRSLLVTTLALLTFAPAAGAAIVPQVGREFCGGPGGCMTPLDTDKWSWSSMPKSIGYSGSTYEQGALLERGDGVRGWRSSSLGCTRIILFNAGAAASTQCRVVPGVIATSQHQRYHKNRADQPYMIGVVTWYHLDDGTVIPGELAPFVELHPEANTPDCVDLDLGGHPVAGTGGPNAMDGTVLHECFPTQFPDPLTGLVDGAQPSVDTTAPVEQVVAQQPVAAATCRATSIPRKGRVAITSAGATCMVATSVVSRYLRSGKAAGWLCVQAAAGNVRVARCVRLATSRAKGARATVTGRYVVRPKR